MPRDRRRRSGSPIPRRTSCAGASCCATATPPARPWSWRRRCASIHSTATPPRHWRTPSTSVNGWCRRWRRPSTPSSWSAASRASARSACGCASAPCASSWAGRASSSSISSTSARSGCAWPSSGWRGARSCSAPTRAWPQALPPAPPASRQSGQIDLAARLRRLDLLAHFSDEQLFHLTRAIHPETAERGRLVFGHGSSGTDLFVIERGEITIRRPTAYGTFPLGILGPGALFGEVNFISRCHRSGDAIASQPSQLLRISAGELEPALRESPALAVQLYWAFWHALAAKLRATNEQLRAFFSAEALPENFVRLRRVAPAAVGADRLQTSDKIRLFREQGLSGRELETLAAFSRELRFPAGARIFEEGDQGKEMYVVAEGRVRIGKQMAGDGEEALAVLERGDFFGEMSLIDGQPRSAGASAHGGELTVLALDQAAVHAVLAMDPQAALSFLQLLCRLIARRLREIDDKVIGWRILSGERTSSSETA